MNRINKISFIVLFLSIINFGQDYCLRFYGNGVNDIDRVKIPIDNSQKLVNIGETFTIEFEMKYSLSENPKGSGAQTGANDDWTLGHVIIDRDIFGNGDYGDYGISLAGGRICFGLNNGSQSYTLITTNQVPQNQWNHIAVTRNHSNGQIAIFVNGNLAASYNNAPNGDISYRIGRSTSYPNDPYLVIGAEKHDYDSSNYPSFRGFLDNVRISNFIRYTTNFTPPSLFQPDANTLVFYDFNEATGDTVYDSATLSSIKSHGIRKFGGNPQGPVYFHRNLANSQQIIFSSNFNASQGSSFSTSGNIGTTTWTINRSGDDWGARIHNNILELTNDATTNTNLNGWIFVSQNTSSFPSSFNPVLSSNSSVINYTFNMRQIRTDPSGFTSNNYGVGFIVGSTGNTRTSGNGYAVVLGNSGSTDPIRFVRFTGGLGGTITDLITASSQLNDVGSEYLSLALKYYPSGNNWELFGRNDGSSSFNEPADGNLSLLGSVVDSTYTSSSLTYLGAYWQGSTSANQTAYFDNISVSFGDIPLPVQLINFDYILNKNSIILNWSTSIEINNYGFEIQRKRENFNSSFDNLSWETIGFVHGNGNSNSLKDYSFFDKNISPGKYSYRLKQIDNDGSFSYSKILNVDVFISDEFILYQNFPNPFNPKTTISFSIPHNEFVSLRIFNLLGEEIQTLVETRMKEGFYSFEFDASKFPTGTYIYKLSFGNKIKSGKMILLK